jgi:hypothetical protein
MIYNPYQYSYPPFSYKSSPRSSGTPPKTEPVSPNTTIYNPYQYSYSKYPYKLYNKGAEKPSAPTKSFSIQTEPFSTQTTIQPSMVNKGKVEPSPINVNLLGQNNPPLPPDTSNVPDLVNGLQARYDLLREQLDQQYQTQIGGLSTQIESQQKLQQQYQQEQAQALGSYKELATQPLANIVTGGIDEYRIKQNYFENQSLINELSGLMNEMNMSLMRGQELIKSGAISKTELQRRQTEATARAGVVQAVINARNNQIGTALNIIDRVYTSIRDDTERQVNYYKDVVNYFDRLRQEASAKELDLTKTQRDYINAQIKTKENEVANMEKTVEYIKGLMVNPETAKIVADAGVNLTDSVETIEQKLAKWGYIQEQQQIATQLAQKGYSEIFTKEELKNYPADAIVQWKDSKGKIHYFVSTEKPANKTTYKDFSDNKGNVTRVWTETDQYGNVVKTWYQGLGQIGRTSSNSILDLLGLDLGSTQNTPAETSQSENPFETKTTVPKEKESSGSFSLSNALKGTNWYDIPTK